MPMPPPDVAFGLIFGLPLLALLVMTVVPPSWQNVQGWLLISFIGIPGFLIVVALAVNLPMLLFGALFLGGVAAAKVKR
ncbi:hypothetical protein [Salinicola sp. DM10]|uniref:hypothetical protein n=1 Tax=Salinicola sp. DM10 TaxID=2815721 RepID=UPI001A907282|nr:hypothetical protein [Salinicola sp. DM10]MCE3025713.1 hypothetical protein [Salinicola sp. DM10]